VGWVSSKGIRQNKSLNEYCKKVSEEEGLLESRGTDGKRCADEYHQIAQ